MSKFACLIAGWLVFVAGAYAGSQSVEKQSSSGAIPQIFVISSVAYRDFEKQLRARGKGVSDLQQYMLDIRNYDITVSARDETYSVTFAIRPLRDNAFFGGVTRYVLDRKTGAILEYTGEK